MSLHGASEPAAFSDLVDLAAEAVGGEALLASDEFFAAKENMLKPGRGVFIAGKYTEQGKWMDGWETRRKRQPGHDWCVIRLGVPGEVRSIDVDTNHFLGNHPAEASLDVCLEPEGDSPKQWPWQPLVDRSALRPGHQNLITVPAPSVASHVRLNIFPDGGVARLRIWGIPRPRLQAGELLDLGSLAHGAAITACSDSFFGRPEFMLRPTSPVNMGDGWETRRRRGPGHDWTVIRLAKRGRLERIEVDTSFFKGNFPESCALETCASGDNLGPLDCDGASWKPLLDRSPLGADQLHVFDRLPEHTPASHVRFHIFPDGGVARLRLWGRLHEEDGS